MKLGLVVAAAFSLAVHARAEEAIVPRQPIAFNHKLHVGQLKQPCQSCHASIDPGEMVDMPEVPKCLACHSAITARTQAERKLAAFGKQNREVDWVRVYQIPTYVRFDHRQHAQAGVKCESCHGPVAERVTLWKEADLSMGACMNCHRQMRASLDCGTCHEPR